MWCCSCLHEDTEPQQYVYDPGGIGLESRPDDWSEAPYVGRLTPGVDVAFMSPGEKEVEKARLQELVKGFAKRAVHGIECQLLDDEVGEAFPAKFFVDRSLRKVRITPRVPDRPEIIIELSQIRETLDMEAGNAVIPRAIHRSLSEDERRRTVIVNVDGPQPPICILEAGPAERERFIMCMKILQLYAQTGTPSSELSTENS
mmetsp:Transcript_41484/g.72868  ORF Transcript_41484/g.72868 Transcript_41484/m.72868 type:complete len:202 (-) Transcript_41484:96-701(-)